MKILIIVDDYLPDSTKIASKMMHDLAIELNKRGNDVHVITPGTKKIKKYEIEVIDNITVYKFRSGDVKNRSKIERAINESLLTVNAWRALKEVFYFNRYRYIIYYSPTIFLGTLVRKLKKVLKAKSYLILRDIFPQWAVDQGIIKEKSIINSYFKYFEKINYKAADFIGLQSENNLKWFNLKCKNKYNSELLYNWANDKDRNPQNTFYREKLNLSNKIVFFYGGNIGQAQDMMNLVRLAINLKINSVVHFVFVGSGDEVIKILDSKEKYKLDNISYLSPVSQEEYCKMLAEFDVGLFSLHYAHRTFNFPGKLLGYMAQGLPILGSVNKNNDLKEVIEGNNAGFITINGDDDGLLKNANKLLDYSLRKKMGLNSRQLLLNKFSVQTAADKILEHLN